MAEINKGKRHRDDGSDASDGEDHDEDMGVASAAAGTPTSYVFATVHASLETPSPSTATASVSAYPASSSVASAMLPLDTAVLLKPVRILLLDIGQGNATLVMGPRDESILIDCGSVTDGKITNELVANATEVINSYLPKKRPSHLNYLIISHPDKDHVNKVSEVLKGFQIDHVLCGGRRAAEYNETGKKDFGVFLEGIGKAVKTSLINAGECYSEGPDHPVEKRMIKTLGNGFDVFIVSANAPSLSGAKIRLALGLDGTVNAGTPANCSSVVLCIRATDPTGNKTAQALICADATFSTEYFILESPWKGRLQSYLLSGGHHGSADSFSPVFLAAVNPSLVHFSANMHAKFRHPTWEVVSRILACCPAMMANKECGPHDIVIGCLEVDRPSNYEDSKIPTDPHINEILELMRPKSASKEPMMSDGIPEEPKQPESLPGRVALGIYAAKLRTAPDTSLPVWLKEVRAELLAMKRIEELFILASIEKPSIREVSPLWYYGAVLDEIFLEIEMRKGLDYELSPEELAERVAKIKKRKKKTPDIPTPTDDDKYWDSSTIDFGLIGSLQGANTGVNWELTLFCSNPEEEPLHWITRF